MDEEQPREHTPQEIVDVDTIRNLDTARMALRWALERLRKETDQKHAVEQKLKDSEKAQQKLSEEQGSLQRTLSLRSSEADERELYYRRLEEFLSLRLEGKLDPAALAHKELEVDQLKRLLEQKLAQTDKDLSARKAALEREFKHAREEAERAARDHARAQEQGLEIKSRTLEQEHLGKMGELREKEILLRQEEKALADRQAHFEDYYASQRLELHTQLKTAREEIEAQVKFRVQMTERSLEERHAAMEAVWAREKALLGRELESWRLKVQELMPRLIDLEKHASSSEEAARQARILCDGNTVVFEQQRAGFAAEKALWDKDRAALLAQVEAWRERADRHLHSTHELAKRLTQSEEQLLVLRAAADREIAAIEERKLDTKRRVEALEGDLDAWRVRHQEALAKIFALENKASGLEASLQQSQLQTQSQHDRFEAHRLSWEQQQKTLLDEIEAGRRRVAEMQPRLLELERGLAAAEEAQAVEERHFLRFEQQKASWESERKALGEELEHWRAKSQDALRRALELERTLASVEEASTNVQAAGDRLAARFDQQRRGWDAEKAELQAELLKASDLAADLRAEPAPETPAPDKPADAKPADEA